MSLLYNKFGGIMINGTQLIDRNETSILINVNLDLWWNGPKSYLKPALHTSLVSIQ